MQVQAVNNHAVKKYNEFCAAMKVVDQALAGMELLIKKANDPNKRFVAAGAITKDELQGMYKAAHEEFVTLSNAARKYQSELQSRGWRV